MRRGVLLVLAIMIAFGIPPANAQEVEVIHFQGMLTGPDGGPLPTDTYNVDFSIWDHATDGFDPLWSETQTVEVNEGLFDVFLGGVNPLSPDVFTPDESESELRFLEIQVEGDDPVTPRLQMGKMPNSFVSSRVLGDIETGPGSLLMRDTDGDPAISLDSGGSEKGIIIIDTRPDATSSSVGLSTGAEETGIIIIDTRPDASEGSIGLSSGLEETGIIIIDTKSDGGSSSIDMKTGGSEKGIIIIDTRPDGSSSGIDMQAGEGSSLIIEDIIPGNNRAVDIGASHVDAYLSLLMTMTRVPVMDLRGSVSGASFEMSGYGSEGQIGPLLGMNTNAAGANFAMAAPGTGGAGAEVADPIIEMITDASGGNFNINWAEPLDMPSPAIEMSVDNIMNSFTINWAEPLDETPSPAIAMGCDMAGDASIVMFQPQPEPPGSDPIIEMLAAGGGGNFMMYGQQAGLTSTPFFEISTYSSGADLKFFDSGGGTTVNINSDGDVNAKRGNFGSGNSNAGMDAFTLGNGNTVSGDNSLAGGTDVVAAHNGSFVWGDANPGPFAPLTTNADNQFMVRSTGGVAFYSSNDLLSGVALGPGASAWSPIIPPGPELDTRPVDGEEILSKLKELPITYYRHKSVENSIENIGPLPEDFNEQFAPGREDRYISLQDEAGVALAGVKELMNIVSELKEENRRLESRIAELERK